MSYKAVAIVVLVLAIPWCLLAASSADAEIDREGKLESYNFDGDYVWVTETLKVDGVKTINGLSETFTEVRMTYKTLLDEPVSIVSVIYYDGNQYVAEESLELKQEEPGVIEQFIDGEWYLLVDSESGNISSSSNDPGLPKIKLTWRGLLKELAFFIGEIIIEYLPMEADSIDVGYYLEEVTEDITVYRSQMAGVPKFFSIGGFLAPALPMTDDNLKKMEPFTRYLIFSRMNDQIRYICPVGLDYNTCYDVLDNNMWNLNIWTARGDSADLIVGHFSDGWVHHSASQDIQNHAHYHYLTENGDASDSKIFYGLSGNKAWMPADGDQWWFD